MRYIILAALFGIIAVGALWFYTTVDMTAWCDHWWMAYDKTCNNYRFWKDISR